MDMETLECLRETVRDGYDLANRLGNLAWMLDEMGDEDWPSDMAGGPDIDGERMRKLAVAVRGSMAQMAKLVALGLGEAVEEEFGAADEVEALAEAEAQAAAAERDAVEAGSVHPDRVRG